MRSCLHTRCTLSEPVASPAAHVPPEEHCRGPVQHDIEPVAHLAEPREVGAGAHACNISHMRTDHGQKDMFAVLSDAILQLHTRTAVAGPGERQVCSKGRVQSQCKHSTSSWLDPIHADATTRSKCFAWHGKCPLKAQGVCGTAARPHLRQTHQPEKPFKEKDLPLGFVGASSTAFSPPAHGVLGISSSYWLRWLEGKACNCAAPTIEPFVAQGRKASGQHITKDDVGKNLLGSIAH